MRNWVHSFAWLVIFLPNVKLMIQTPPRISRVSKGQTKDFKIVIADFPLLTWHKGVREKTC